jgi:copper(I)-binding protein
MRRSGLAFLLWALPLGASAQPVPQTLRVEEAWVLPAKQQADAALHVVLANPTSSSVMVTGAASPAAAQVLLRYHTAQAGVVTIQTGGTITLAPRSRARLLPAATEIYLSGLKYPLQAGREIPVALTYASGDVQIMRVLVKDK